MSCWVFGYGSLVWRPAFAHVERRAGTIEGWARRFWQGSTDHRGVPGAPGRVVTLVPQAGARTWGVAYRLPEEERETILAALDHREKGGYRRLELTVTPGRGEQLAGVLAWIAVSGNPNWLGPAPIEDIARTARRSVGPSGPNEEYVRRLHDWHQQLGVRDVHLEAVIAAMDALR